MYQYQDYYHRARQKEPQKPYASGSLHPDEYEDAAEEFYVYPEMEEGEELETSLVSPTPLSAQTSRDGYDPDASAFPQIHVRLYGEHGQGEAEGDVLAAAVSSDDTVWERGAVGQPERGPSVSSDPSTPTRANMGWGRQAQVHGREESREQQRASPSLTQIETPGARREAATPSETRPALGEEDEEDAPERLEQVEQREPAQLHVQSPTPP
ncbi:hypothetical protein C0993_007142, partial [Termitomyces sp. T159_Od127]